MSNNGAQIPPRLLPRARRFLRRTGQLLERVLLRDQARYGTVSTCPRLPAPHNRVGRALEDLDATTGTIA